MITKNRLIALVQSLGLLVTGVLVVSILFLFGFVGIVMAQGDPPIPTDIQELPSPTVPGAVLSSDGLWMMQAGGEGRLIDAESYVPQASGGPDDYGYTWNDAVPLGWISTSGGVNTDLTDRNNNHSGPIDIGFPFKYYENVYDRLYVSLFGFVTFTDTSNWWNSQSRVPSAEQPNDLIAPQWVPIDRVDGYVRYLRGGVAPNRWFVVEWNRVVSDCCNGVEVDQYTFEVVLHENGDINFQYSDMAAVGSYSCMASGIEDSTGLDGLTITDFCRSIGSNHAVKISRPPVSARTSVYPRYEGRFTRAGAVETFQIAVRNTGELGADTFDVYLSSAWPATLYAADGITPLTDTDGDTTLDVGSVPQGGSRLITVKVQTPAVVNVGDNNTVGLTVRSSVDVGKQKTIMLRTAIPAPFAQTYSDEYDGAVDLYLTGPTDAIDRKVSGNYIYGEPSVAEMPSGYIDFWTMYRRNNQGVYVRELAYVLLDRANVVTRGVGLLTNYDGAMVNVYDYSPALAVTPDGHVGILWYQYLWNSSTSQRIYNIFFAVLDGTGNPTYGPVNLTNNTTWDNGSGIGVPQFWEPQIAATEDNRFVLGWRRYSRQDNGSLSDIYVAVRNANGTEVKPVTKFTAGVAGGNYYYYPALTKLQGARVLLAYNGPQGRVSYAVLDSAGNTIKGETAATTDYSWHADAVQLSDGRILLAWSGGNGTRDAMVFEILDGNSYNVVSGPRTLNNPAGVTGDGYVSVTADTAGRGILTWMDYEYSYRPHLYYALVDSAGNVRTEPTTFLTSRATDPYISTNFNGYGNTSRTIQPTTQNVDAYVKTPPVVGGQPAGHVTVPIQIGNMGRQAANSVQVSAILDANLSYIGATPAPTSVVGNTVTWQLPSLDFLGSGQLWITTSVPSATIGSRYPVTVTVISSGLESNAADNSAVTEVMVARQSYLPLVGR